MKNDDLKIHKERVNMVVAIVVAAALGLVLNIVASIFYDVVVKGDVSLSALNQTVLTGIFLALVVIEAFIEFLVHDYKNEMNLNRSFWKRFFDYFFDKHWFQKVTIYTGNALWGMLKWLIWVLFIIASFQITGWEWLLFLLSLTLFVQSLKRLYKRKKL